jgi:ANTAR domain-containing protein
MTAPALLDIPYPTHDPLRQSVTSLARFAMQAAGADGYSWCEVDSATGALVPRYSNGVSVPLWEKIVGASALTSRDGTAVFSYPVRAEGELTGLLAFVFRRDAIQEEELAILNRMAALIESLLAVPHTTTRLAAKIGRLDAELAGIKIAERTHGLLATGVIDPDAVEGIVLHVETVLQSRRFGTVLERLLPDLQERVEERKAVVRAKALLQGVHGMTEEEAYLHLRYRSRSTRRRLGEVAQELIEHGRG